MSRTVRAIGLLSGLSMDGIDAAAVEITDGLRLQTTLHAFLTHPYPPAVRDALLAVCRPGQGSATDVCRLTMVLGELFAQAAQAGWLPHEVAVIGSHGQATVRDMADGHLAGFRTAGLLRRRGRGGGCATLVPGR